MCNCNFRIYICHTNIYSLLCNGSSNIFSFCNISRDNSSCPHKIRFYHRSKLIGIQSNELQRQSKNRTDCKNYTKYPHSFISINRIRNPHKDYGNPYETSQASRTYK